MLKKTIIGLIFVIIILLFSGVWAVDILNLNDNYFNNEDLSKAINEENNTNNLNSNEKINIPDAINNDLIYNKNSTHLILTSKSTFIKSSIGNSMVKLEVPKDTSAQISIITDDIDIDTGYVIIILAKDYYIDYGVEFWEDYFFWKQNEIILEKIDHSTKYVEMISGTYDLFILSDFGKWGITIESDLNGTEYEYEMPIMEDIIFKTIEFEQNDNKITPFKREIQFKETVFDINSKGMLFRFFYLYANLDGFGIDSVDVETKIYDPEGNEFSSTSSEFHHTYHSEFEYVHTEFSWDAIYINNGRWKGSGNCTIKTNGPPNIENYNIHMFEFIIDF